MKFRIHGGGVLCIYYNQYLPFYKIHYWRCSFRGIEKNSVSMMRGHLSHYTMFLLWQNRGRNVQSTSWRRNPALSIVDTVIHFGNPNKVYIFSGGRELDRRSLSCSSSSHGEHLGFVVCFFVSMNKSMINVIARTWSGNFEKSGASFFWW